MLPTNDNFLRAQIRTVFEKLYPVLVGFARYIAWRRGFPEQAAEDALQDAVVLFLRRVDAQWLADFLKASPREQIGYFLTAIHNNTLKAITRNRLNSLPEKPYEDETALDPAEEMGRADTRRAVREAIQRLPKRQREVMELTLQEYSDEEIAKKLNTSTVNVRVRKLHARRNLQRILQGQDITP